MIEFLLAIFGFIFIFAIGFTIIKVAIFYIRVLFFGYKPHTAEETTPEFEDKKG